MNELSISLAAFIASLGLLFTVMRFSINHLRADMSKTEKDLKEDLEFRVNQVERLTALELEQINSRLASLEAKQDLQYGILLEIAQKVGK